jgi:mannose-6-phosphate isomerase-like protein (cupin superfamily)
MAKRPFSTAVNQGNTMSDTSFMNAYKIGESDYSRPWGGYIVTDVRLDAGTGDEVVEKDITVNGFQMLSVQSHVGRAEIWSAVKGELTALIDGTAHKVPQGQSITIPKGAIHAMINMGNDPIVVHEIQRGICREADNTRYYDQGGRPVVQSNDPRVLASIATAKRIQLEIEAKQPGMAAVANGVK